jgi:hypothetical protein
LLQPLIYGQNDKKILSYLVCSEQKTKKHDRDYLHIKDGSVVLTFETIKSSSNMPNRYPVGSGWG